MNRARLIVLALATLLSGCGSGSLPPFDWSPKPAPPDSHENFTRVGVCYNRATATRRQVTQIARSTCDPGTIPYLLEQDFAESCPLLTPERATYACLKPGTPPPRRH